MISCNTQTDNPLFFLYFVDNNIQAIKSMSLCWPHPKTVVSLLSPLLPLSFWWWQFVLLQLILARLLWNLICLVHLELIMRMLELSLDPGCREISSCGHHIAKAARTVNTCTLCSYSTGAHFIYACMIGAQAYQQCTIPWKIKPHSCVRSTTKRSAQVYPSVLSQ